MNIAQLLEIARKQDSDYTGVELIELINSTMIDICNEVNPFQEKKQILADGIKTEFVLSDFDIQDRFISLIKFQIWKRDILPIGESISGDDVFFEQSGIYHIGRRENDIIVPFENQTPIVLHFNAYPEPLTLDSVTLPYPWSHSLMLWRVKADLFAMAREWDRAGYFNRRYQTSLRQLKHITFSQSQNITINTNTRI